MSESEWVQRFNADADALLEHGGPVRSDANPEAYRQTLDMAQRLATTDFSAASPIRQPLRRQLMSQVDPRELWKLQSAPGADIMSRSATHPLRQRLTAAVVITLILTALLTLTTPGRTLAEGIVRRIGAITLSSEPTAMEQIAGEPLPTPGLTSGEFIPAPVLSLEEASAVAGFPIYQIGEVPTGYQLVTRGAERQENGVVNVWEEYRFVAGDLLAGGAVHYLTLSQDHYPEGLAESLARQAVGNAPVSEVTVRGQPGLWVEQAPLLAQDDGQGRIEARGMNLLLWQEGDVQFTLQSDTLSLQELTYIAGTLTQ